MQNRRPLLSYLLINVAVSAFTMLLVLIIWNRLNAPNLPEEFASSTAASPAAVSTTQGVDSALLAGQLQLTTIIGVGDVQNEYVLIEHIGDDDIRLADWRLTDEDGNSYTFPALELHPGASVQVFSRQGQDSVTQLFWNRTEPVWAGGEAATLLDPNGQPQATYTIP